MGIYASLDWNLLIVIKRARPEKVKKKLQKMLVYIPKAFQTS